jgi:hypothetical protein
MFSELRENTSETQGDISGGAARYVRKPPDWSASLPVYPGLFPNIFLEWRGGQGLFQEVE